MKNHTHLYIYAIMIGALCAILVNNVDLKLDVDKLEERLMLIERINEEQQAFIRNHRIDHLDIQEKFNLHAEQLGLIWNRIP